MRKCAPACPASGNGHGITVAILYLDDEVAYDCHAGTVAGELLVGHLRIVLLRLYELMIEIQIVGLSAHELASVLESLHQQAVQFRGSVEVIALSRVRGIGRISCSQFRNPSQDSVRAACAKSGMKREMGHQLDLHVLNIFTPQK